MTETPNRCAGCGARLPAGATEEVCPLCVPDDMGDGEPGGRVLGDCELFEEIGRGGMGVVWRGRQRGLDRSVAVKTLPGGDLAGADARRRFHTEARATARLKHPNIVSIFEVGEADGMPYFVMELVHGRTVGAVVAESPAPARQAARWARDAARAVAHAHSHGVLHRDLKPSNILIEPGSDGGRPRVMDFGLAKLTDGEGEMTRTGAAAGSPSYMPPEQARGGEASVAGDVYGLGAVLYHALTGRPPFQGESLAAVLAQVEKAEPLAPRRLSGSVPRDLETICLKCLEKNPARRYLTAEDLAQDLERHLEGRPVVARPLGRVTRLLRLARRRPWEAAAVGLVTALIVSGMLFLAWTAHRERGHQEALRVERDAAELALMRSRLGEARSLVRLRLPDSRSRALAVTESLSGGGVPPEIRAEALDVALAALALPEARAEPLLGEGAASDDWTMAAADTPRRRWALALYRGPVRIRSFTAAEDTLAFETAPRVVTALIGFSPDGRWLAARHNDELGVWDTAPGAGERLVFSARPWKSSSFGFMKTAFTPDGRAVLRADAEEVVANALPGGQELARWKAADGAPLEVNALSFDPAGGLVALALSREPVLELRTWPDGEVVKRFAGLSRPATTVALTNGAARLAAGDAEGNVMLWHTAGAEGIRQDLPSHSEALRGLAFNSAGSVLYSTSEDGSLRAWDCQPGAELVRMPFDSGVPGVSEDGWLLGTGHAAGRLSTARIEPSPVLHRFRPADRPEARQAISFTPDSRFLYCLSAGGGSLRALPGGEEWGRIAFPQPYSLLTGSRPEGGVWLSGPSGLTWFPTPATDSAAASSRPVFPAARWGWDSLCATPDGRFIAVADSDGGRAAVLDADAPDPAAARFLDTPGRGTGSLALSPDGALLAVGFRYDRGLDIFDVKSGTVLRSFDEPPRHQLAWSPDGRWLATGGPEPKLLDTRSWSAVPLPDLSPNHPPAGAAAFAPVDGAGVSPLLALASGDTRLALVRLPEARLLATLEAPEGRTVYQLRFSPDGRWLGAATAGGEVQLWDRAAVEKITERYAGK